MAHDVEFLPVGEGERSGDAIVVRWEENGLFKVGVIDGGTKESGQAAVDHIKKYYGEKTEVEFALNTHPDCDHCSGLTVILESLKVNTLWMHRPWMYSAELLDLINDDRVTEDSLEKRLKDKLAMAWQVEKLATAKKVLIKEPFQGQSVGPFTVLSPSLDWYKQLVVKFREMPKAKSFAENLFNKAADSVKFVLESMDFETLREGGQTSYENESSVILYASGLSGVHSALLTGDAGIEALTKAADYADTHFPGWNRHLSFVQIPHHGSRRNVSPSILNRILGDKVADGTTRGWAYACSSKGSTTHPRKAVLNAFIRRGYNCTTTKDGTKRHYKGTPERDNWSPIKPIPFSTEAESYD